jgi:hypothetical protein
MLCQKVGAEGAKKGFLSAAEGLMEPGHRPEEIGIWASTRRPYGTQHRTGGALQGCPLSYFAATKYNFYIHFAMGKMIA